MNTSNVIRTPDQRLRVFVSSTLRELADERAAVRDAITQLRLAPVMFELGARPHAAINLYRAYLEQSHIFIGVYWQSYGYVAPGMEVSGLEDEYLLAGDKPKLIYVKTPASDRDAGLVRLLGKIKNDERVSYKYFSKAEELSQLVENDLALILTERFEESELKSGLAGEQLNNHLNNLPNQITSFVGREEEIAEVLEILKREEVRLLTLTGLGGTGKTRLSLKIASMLLNDFDDGVLFVSLAEAREPGLVVSKIAEVLGVQEGGSQTLLKSVIGYLRDKNLLIVLDNFEQVLSAAPLLPEILQEAPQIKMLVTSRTLLNVNGEFEFQVPTLKVPVSNYEFQKVQLAEYESVKMFVDRAMAANTHFTLDDHNAPIIGEICGRLDGLPLALELAAARLKMLSPDKLLYLLSDRLKLLTGGSQDLPERQQTLRKTLEWSIQLLDQNEQALFSRLGVFMGGFTLESADEVCQVEKELGMDIYQGLETLLNNSLIQLDHQGEIQPRFRMLETVRDYALEQIEKRGEKRSLQHLHAEYYMDKMNQISPILMTKDAEQGIVWVDTEHDNIRAAMAYFLQDESLIESATWLLIAMMSPWYRFGFLEEGREFANRLLNSTSTKENMLARCFALLSSGAMAMWQGDLNDALIKLDDALILSKQLEQPFAIAIADLFLGTTQVNRGDDPEAVIALQEALELFTQLSIAWYQAVTLVHLANATLGMGDVDGARIYLDRADAISQQIEEKWLISFVQNNYGEVARTSGNYEEAQSYYEKSEALLRSIRGEGDLARLVHNLGTIALQKNALDKAGDYFNTSLAMFIKLGNQRGMAECLASKAGLWAKREKIMDAVTLLGAAQQLLDETGATWWPADRVEVENNLKKLHNLVGIDQFDDAWWRGKSMHLKDALIYGQKDKEK